MRIPSDEFRTKDFRVHQFLADVPLRDVWILHLRGGGKNRVIGDVGSLFADGGMRRVGSSVRLLFALRSLLGKTFGWDHERHRAASRSYSKRPLPLQGEHRRGALKGRAIGPFRLLYEFDNEALGEVINATVHAFLLMAMEPVPQGYTVYLAVYVKKVSWFTPVYMALIDPFRRLLVYPALIRGIEEAWVLAYGKEA